MADDPNQPDSGSTNPPTSETSDNPPPPQQPAGPLSILVFELYFLALSIAAMYALWTIWPYSMAPPAVRVFGFLLDFRGDLDARLLLVALLSGLLGALVHATTSLATFLGNRSFYGSWIPWYVFRPVIGMTLGLLFYLIVRGGIVSASGANAINPFGVAAISGLAGLFSKQTVDKLRDIFEHAFPISKGGDAERQDALNTRTISTPVGGQPPANPQPGSTGGSEGVK